MNWRDDGMLERSEILFDARAVTAAIDRVAAAVTERLAPADPVVIPILLGGLPFAGALLTRLPFELQIDYAHVSRYRGGVRGGTLHWLCKPRMPLAARDVLLVDDVLDDGETLSEIARWCREEAGAANVSTAVLVRKRNPRRSPALDADFVGLDAGPRFLFGFGMDIDERYRHLPEIRALPEEIG